MKIQDVKREHPPFDVASGLGAAFIKQGTHELFKPVVVQPPNRTEWQVKDGAWVDGSTYPPIIYVRCGNCGAISTFQGPNAGKQPFIHCPAAFRIREIAPKNISEAYEQKRKAYYGKR